MGRIAIPRAKYGPPTKVAKAKPPWPVDMTRKRREMAGFGRALTKVGAQFLEVITKIDIDNQLSEFEGVTTEQINTSISEYVNDPEPSTYLERFGQSLKSIRKENIEKIKNPQAKRIAENWFKKRSAGWQKQVQSIAFDQAEQNTKEAVDLAEFRAIKQRDPDLIDRSVTRAVQNGVMGQGEGSLIIEQTHYKILLGQIEDEALETIYTERAKGVDVGLALSRGLAAIEEYRKEITPADKNQISNKVERSFMWTLSGEIAKEEENRGKNLDKGDELIQDPNATYDDIESLDLPTEDKDKIKAAKDAYVKEGPPTTDAENFNTFVGRIIDLYGDPKIYGDVTQEIHNAYYDRSLSKKDYRSLSDYMNKFQNYPTGVVGALKEAYQYGASNIPAWTRFKGKDQERIAAYNKAMFDLLKQKTKDGVLTITQEDIFKESRLLAQLYKNLSDEEFEQWEGLKKPEKKEEAPEVLPEPKTKEEYDKLKSGTKYKDPTGVERTKR